VLTVVRLVMKLDITKQDVTYMYMRNTVCSMLCMLVVVLFSDI